MELCHGRGSGGWGQGLHQRVVGMERDAHGCGHGPELPDLCLDLGCSCAVPGVGLDNPRGSFPTWDIL